MYGSCKAAASGPMDYLGSDHVVLQRRRDATKETVFSVWFVPRLYTEIPRITEAVESEWELPEQSSAGS
jgi:hypothetical protein